MDTLLLVCLAVAFVSGAASSPGGSPSYESVKSLGESLYRPHRYSKKLRPIRNQSEPIVVKGLFDLVAIASVDDVHKRLVTNANLRLYWRDERITWNSTDYGGIRVLPLQTQETWLPVLEITNALDNRDAFTSDKCYTAVTDEGITGWMPSGILQTNCDLNLKNFPFDVQNCEIQMCPVFHPIQELHFLLNEHALTNRYHPNSGWDLLEAKVTNDKVEILSNITFSCPTVHLRIKRRPMTIVMNVIAPAMLLSLLNNLVFLIPASSGEKIGYAITVLLSVTVFLGIVSSMTPQISDVVPALTIYLFVLLLTSVVTVTIVIFTEHLHQQDEKDEETQNNPDVPLTPPSPKSSLTLTAPRSKPKEGRRLARCVNLTFFVLVMVTASIDTIWIFTFTKTSF